VDLAVLTPRSHHDPFPPSRVEDELRERGYTSSTKNAMVTEMVEIVHVVKNRIHEGVRGLQMVGLRQMAHRSGKPFPATPAVLVEGVRGRELRTVPLLEGAGLRHAGCGLRSRQHSSEETLLTVAPTLTNDPEGFEVVRAKLANVDGVAFEARIRSVSKGRKLGGQVGDEDGQERGGTL